jgi:pimeloyl-ACP methyl ester carboxylesterase
LSVGNTVALATERLVAPIEGMHRAIANRWFGIAGSVGEPVQAAHDSISSVVYRSIRLGGAVLGVGLDYGLNVSEERADMVQAWVNGVWGDGLGDREPRLAIKMSIRAPGGQPVPIDGLERAYPQATGRIVVLVHGLTDTERCWRGTSVQPGLAEALEARPELSAVAVRYNSGLSVSDNGAQLAALLDELTEHWPVLVESIALVGHSMGGLVCRSACVAAETAGFRWLRHLDDVVAIGSPHRGAPLEKLANVVGWGLEIAAETRPLADFVKGRSRGIKDLRFGAIVEEDWAGLDPDALLRNTVGEHSLPPGVRHHFVAGVVTADPQHPVGVVMGDLLVRTASGTASQRLEPTNVEVVGNTRHSDLRNNPAVIDHVMGWLDPPAP